MVSLQEQLLPEEADVLARTAGRELDLSAMFVVQDVFRAAAALRSRLESAALQDEGLTWSGFTMLFCLWVWGPLETRELALRMGVTRPTVSGVTDTLERRDLVERRGHAEDGRLRTVALTAAGERTFEELFPHFNAEESLACAGLAASERSHLAALLRRLVTTLREGT
ncbi:MAG: MarR family transcriptional regulator, organic hydroperoxide resistance regulator [Gaiellales bacterium]|jgi:DNA-binding MarR family transcriptional regulator|nr:MarR family transcriptional regulator, organic hydroperoxide resistance regulator [Gaiellales bacterium]